MASRRSLEVKVGLLILSAVVLLGGFVLVMGGINFQPTYELTVGFDNPGGLQSGAPLKIAGVNVGRVKALEFAGGLDGKKGQALPLVSVRVSIEKRFQSAIHENATFYITTQGVLGEQFLAVDPGSPERPVLAAGAVVRGLDPPRIDRLIAESYDLLHTTVAALRENKPELRLILEGLGQTLKGTGTFFVHNQERLDRVAENVEKMSHEGVLAVEGARRKYVENPAIERVIHNADQLAAVAARELPPILSEGRETLTGAAKLVRALSKDEQLARIDRILADAEGAAHAAKLTLADAHDIAGRIKRGKGSVGALVMDEALFDDLQELARDLKHNPWKFFWKE